MFLMQLFMQPVDYGLSKTIGSKGEENLRILATVFTYILRKVYTQLRETQISSMVKYSYVTL